MVIVTQERLKNLLEYNPTTGIFTYKKRDISSYNDIRYVTRFNRYRAGKEAGNSHIEGYLTLTIDGKVYKCHRLAWFYVHGEWPDQIDHVNGIRRDNRILNLRNVSKIENGRNQGVYVTNKSGLPGVYWNNQLERWHARINSPKRIHLGFFDNIFDAACAKKSAEKKLCYHENHGRKLSHSLQNIGA